MRAVASSHFAPVREAVDEEPAVAAAVLTVLAAAIVLALFGTDKIVAHPPPAPRPVAPQPVTLGASPGTEVSGYIRAAGARARQFAAVANGRTTYAIVDFRRYLRAGDLGPILGHAALESAYVRYPSVLPTPVCAVQVRSAAGMNAAVATAADLLQIAVRREVSDLQKDRGRPSQDNGGISIDDRVRIVAADRVSARHLSDPKRCRCVFAVLAHVGVDELTRLSGERAVRVVDPAPIGAAPPELLVQPLQPQVVHVVSQPVACV
jgi:hypothetical protein